MSFSGGQPANPFGSMVREDMSGVIFPRRLNSIPASGPSVRNAATTFLVSPEIGFEKLLFGSALPHAIDPVKNMVPLRVVMK